MDESVVLTETEIEEERRLLRWYRKIAYAAGNFITVLSISVWFPYNVLFFQNVLGLPADSAGNIVLIAQVGGAISTPFIGMWSDQCICRIPGKRKVFHLIGIITLPCVLFFLWYECLGCSDVPVPYKVLYYSCFAIVFQFSWASIQIGQLALLPELTSQKKTQVQLNSMRYSFTIVANLLVFGCFWGLLEIYNNGSNKLNSSDINIFLIMAAVVIGIGFPSSLMFQLFIPEKRNANLEKLEWYKWLINPRFYLTALCLIASRYVVLMPQTYMSYYFLRTLEMDKTSVAKGPLILYISSFICTLVVKRCRNYIGDKMTYFLGMAVVWGALIFFWLKDPTSDPDSIFNFSRDCIYIATILLGAGGAVVLVISLSMISFLVGKYKGSSAFVYGWILFADRLSNGIGVNVIQHSLPSDTQLLPEFYRHVMVYVPFVGSGLGLSVIIAMIAINWINKRKKASLLKQQPMIASINYGTINDNSSTNSTSIAADDECQDDEIIRLTETL